MSPKLRIPRTLLLLVFVLAFSPDAFSQSPSLAREVLKMEDSLPQGLSISGIQNYGKNLSVKGTAPSNMAILAFIQNLEKLESVSSVDLRSSRKSSDGKRSFDLLVKANAAPPAKQTNTPNRTPAFWREKASSPNSPKQALSEEEKEILKDLSKTVEDTGSNLAYTMLKMREHKFLSDKKLDATSKQNDRRSSRLRSRLSQFTLQSNLQSSLFNSQNLQRRRSRGLIGGEIDVLTGRRAVQETLQLQSIGTGPRGDTGPLIHPISQLTPLKVRSHPWQEMLKKSPAAEQSPILSLVPEDHFLVYFKDAPKIAELERFFRETLSFGNHFFELKELLDIRQKVSARLGIDKFEQLETLVSEVAFLSEDLDFYPGTQYALIIKFKNPLLSNLSDYLPENETKHARLGDYFIISTSAKLLDVIKDSAGGGRTSMRNAQDFLYMTTVLDKKRDGLVYFSERFILKLVSPEHRINAARRNKIIEKLASLQYTVLSYRTISGRWPSSFSQIIEEGYLKPLSVSKDFSIEEGGVVRHTRWGSLEQLSSLSEVDIKQVSAAEKNDYERFSRGYQRYWTRFFDPIGVGITLGQQVYFQAVVLPLINQSEYKDLELLTGGEAISFSLQEKPLRIAPIALFSHLNFDDWARSQSKCAARRNKEPLSREQCMARVNKEIQDSFKISQPVDVFNMIGDEVSFNINPGIPFSLANLGELDAYLAVKVKDQPRLDALIRQIYRGFYTSSSRGRGSFVPFQLSSPEPMKNTHKNIEYYIIPTGFINLYYFYHGDVLYIAIGQLPIHRLIDNIGKIAQPTPAQKRALTHIGKKHNVLLLADFNEFSNARNYLLTFAPSAFQTSSVLRSLQGYLTDAALFGAAVGGDDPSVKRFFKRIPQSVFGVDIVLEQGTIYLGQNNKAKLEEVIFPNRYSYRNRRNNEAVSKSYFLDLQNSDWRDTLLQELEKIKSAAIGLSLSPDGLDVKIAIDNPQN